ncbi:MAG: aminoglycoside phosphotransferase family protein [Chloroflexota bacterium]
MREVKPPITPLEVTTLLENYFEQPVKRVAPLGTGHIARVFSFQTGGQAYVIRFVTEATANTFKVELALSALLKKQDGTGMAVPLPPILHHGMFGEYHFAVAPMAAGQPLDELPPEAAEQILPKAIEALDAIHEVDVSGTQGYGWLDVTANNQLPGGLFPSWPAFLLSVINETEGDFYGFWHGLFETSFLERPLFDQLYNEMESLFPYLPKERYLVHGDYGFNNVLAQDGEITAVIDWNAKYGDFLFDIARLNFIAPDVGYPDRFLRYYAAQNRHVPNFAERLRCYQCYTALDGMRFFAKMDQPDGYAWVKRRIREASLDTE